MVSYQLSTLAPQMWEFVPQSVRKCKILNEFKTKIKSWYPHHCPCRLCKTYIAQLGFIWSAYTHLFIGESGYIFTVWCNYDALVSFAVVTIIFYMYLFNFYLNLLIYLCTWSYLLLLLLLSLSFLTLTLIKHIDWCEQELVLCILWIWCFFFYYFVNMKYGFPIRSNPRALISLSQC